jgi:hypothetical protein
MAYFWGRTFCVGNSKIIIIAPPSQNTTQFYFLWLVEIVDRGSEWQQTSVFVGCVGTKKTVMFLHHCKNAGCCCCCSTFMYTRWDQI